MRKKILITLGLLVLTLFIFFNFILEGLVKNKLQDLLRSTFGTYYSLTFDTNYTSLTNQGFTVGFEGVELKTDTTNKLMMAKFAPLFFSATKLEVSNISVPSLLFKSDLDLESFILEDPKLLFLIGKLGNKKENPSAKENSESLIKEVEIGKFSLNGGSAAFVFMANQSDTLYAGKGLNVNFELLDVLFDETGINPQNVNFSQATIGLQNVLYNPKKSAYRYQIEDMSLDYEKGQLTVNEIDLIPKRSLLEMTMDEQYQKTMFDIKIAHFGFYEIVFDSLKNFGNLSASRGELTDAKFSLLRNANFPLDPKNKTLMHESLVQSTFPIDMDSLFINNATIDYQLVPKGKADQGRVMLSEINGYLANLNSERTLKDTLHLFLESRFMEYGKFTFAADFPLFDVPGHVYRGHISELPFTDLNMIVEPMVNVQLNEGIIQDIYFTGICSERVTTGEMIFDYDNLKLQVNNDKKGKRNWLVSDIGNLIVRHKSKKDKDGRSRSVDYTYERPLYQGHIGFYLNGLLDGMMKNLLPGPVYKQAIKGMTPKSE